MFTTVVELYFGMFDFDRLLLHQPNENSNEIQLCPQMGKKYPFSPIACNFDYKTLIVTPLQKIVQDFFYPCMPSAR